MISGFLNLNYRDKDGNTALHISKSNTFIFELLKHGADFTLKNNEDKTPYELFIMHDNYESLHILCESSPKWLQANLYELIKLQITHSAYRCLENFENHYSDDFYYAITTHKDLLSQIVAKDDLKILSFILESYKFPITYFSFDPCPRKQIIKLIASFYSKEEIKDDLDGIPSEAKQILKSILDKTNTWMNHQHCVFKTPLHAAAEEDNVIAIQEFSTKCKTVDIEYYYNKVTPLFLAIKSGSSSSSALLVAFGASCLHKCMKTTPIHEAAKKNNHQLIRFMHEKTNPDINVLDDEGYTPLHCALSNGSEDAAFVLLELGADVKIITKNQNSVLHLAIKRNASNKLLHALIDQGADIETLDSNQFSPFLAALVWGYQYANIFLDIMTEASISHLKVESFNYEMIWNKPIIIPLLGGKLKKFFEQNCILLLSYSCQKCHIEVLLDTIFQLSQSKCTKKDLINLLKESIFAGNFVSASYLLKIEPDLIKAHDDEGNTPIHWIIEIGKKVSKQIFGLFNDVPEVLCEANNDKENGIHYAVRFNNDQIIETFAKNSSLNQKAINMKNKDGFTPLELANILRKIQYVKILSSVQHECVFHADKTNYKYLRHSIHKGFDGNFFSVNGLTLISHFIISLTDEQESLKCVKLLLKAGADPSIEDDMGFLPIHYAVRKQFNEVSKLLLDKGGILYYCDEAHYKEFMKLFVNDEERHFVDKLIDEHVVRANTINELRISETNYAAGLTAIMKMFHQIVGSCPRLANLLLCARSLLNISNSLVSRLDHVCKRVSPSSCIGSFLVEVAQLSEHLLTYTLTYRTERGVNDDPVLHWVTEFKEQTVEDILYTPLQRLTRYEEFVNRVLKHTSKDHSDFNDLTKAYVMWKSVAKKCNRQSSILETKPKYHSLVTRFIGIDNFPFNPSNQELIQFTQLAYVSDSLTPSRPTKSQFVYVFVFENMICIGWKLKDHVEIDLAFNANDVFFDFLRDQLVCIYTPIGSITLKFDDMINMPRLKNDLTFIDTSFYFDESKSNMIHCSYVSENDNVVKTNMLNIECKTQDEALARAKELLGLNLKRKSVLCNFEEMIQVFLLDSKDDSSPA